MSLIYDYLKIDGQGEAGKNAKIEIPPALLKGDDESPARFNKQPLLILLSACFVIGLLILSIYKINSTRQVLQIPAEPVITQTSQQAVQTEQSVPAADETAQTVQVAAGSHDGPVPATVGRRQQQPVAEEPIQVFPEPDVQKKPVARSGAEETGRLPAVSRKTAARVSVQQAARQINPPVPRSNSLQAGKTYSAKSEKYYQAGLQAQQGGDLRLAEIFYKKALAGSGDHLNSMINLSALYVQQERYQEAEDILWDILGQDRTNSKALVNLGMVNLYRHKYARAEEFFNKAILANPREENGLVNLAYLAEQKKDYAAAEIYYKQILQISPANLEVLLAYGYLLEQQGRFLKASAIYQECLALEAVKKDRELSARILERRNQVASDARISQPQ